MQVTSINNKFSITSVAHSSFKPFIVTSEHPVEHNSKRGVAVILSVILMMMMMVMVMVMNDDNDGGVMIMIKQKCCL
jgi:hypothetical protein